jgi:hypothetical protein
VNGEVEEGFKKFKRKKYSYEPTPKKAQAKQNRMLLTELLPLHKSGK